MPEGVFFHIVSSLKSASDKTKNWSRNRKNLGLTFVQPLVNEMFISVNLMVVTTILLVQTIYFAVFSRLTAINVRMLIIGSNLMIFEICD